MTLAQQADNFAYFLSILMQYRELAAVGGDLTICHLCARRGRTSKRIGSIRKSAKKRISGCIESGYILVWMVVRER